MGWLRDPAWQQGLAILLVIAGAALIYLGAARTEQLGGMAHLGVGLFVLGVGVPLVAQVLRAPRAASGKSEEV